MNYEHVDAEIDQFEAMLRDLTQQIVGIFPVVNRIMDSGSDSQQARIVSIMLRFGEELERAAKQGAEHDSD